MPAAARVKQLAAARRKHRSEPTLAASASPNKKSPIAFLQSGFCCCLKNPAIPTFALVGTIIGSESLTTVFGMGTGGPFGYGHRERNTEAVARCVP